ncbi:tyrosine-type recombinase/integrase [Spirillospora sp. CA-294931]|uniref:tyrosine-type recombinase/integrase n=1 Tax=Spirillospora sp. CA-294931 TaxID=3240042 RepID=UPI003D8DE461
MSKPRRPNRTSTWYQAKDGTWHGKVWMGELPDGSPDRRHRERQSEPEIIKAIRELEKQRDAGLSPKPGRPPKVHVWFAYCLDTLMPLKGASPRGIMSYRSDVNNWILPHIGQTRIDQVRPDQLEAIYVAMQKAGAKPSHIRKVHAIISSFIGKWRKREGIGGVNPASLVEPPEVGEGAKEHLTRKEARLVIEESQRKGHRNRARWSVGLTLGARQGETLGLRWPFLVVVCQECSATHQLTEWWAEKRTTCEECDSTKLSLQGRIWWQLQRQTWQHGCDDVKACTEGKHKGPCPARCPKAKRTSGRPHKCVPKDAKGLCKKGCTRHASTCPARKGGGLVFREVKEKRRKTIALAWQLEELLKAQWIEQRAERLRAGDHWEEHDVVFAQWNGRPIDPRRDWQEWADLQKAAGIPHHKVHATRHTAATLLLETGVALSVVQEILGHSDIRVTRGYTHVSSPLMQDGAARIGKTLLG